MYPHDTIVAPATAPGAGAIAIVRLSGPRAIEIAGAIWRPLSGAARPPRLTARRLHLGEISDPATGAAIDRALCLTAPGPRTFTGEHVAELHCHGGPYLVRRIVALAIAAGARMAEPGEFSRRAFLNGKIDLTEAEAIADLIGARAEGALQNALAQLSGALARTVEPLRQAIIAAAAELEAEIDFSDEDLKLPSREALAASLDAVSQSVRLLHDSFARGRLMREGTRATLIGKPNAGKSSLMNLLLGADRAIVTAAPGTTRDIIEDTVQLGPFCAVLQDTAGLRDGGDEAERLGVGRAVEHAAAASLVLAVFDCSRPFEPDDRRTVELSRGRPGVAILNKRDLPARLEAEELRVRGVCAPIMEVSALDPADAVRLRDEMERAIEALAGGAADGTVAISRERHRDALARALDALAAARAGALARMPPEIVAVDVALAAEALGSITGAVTAEDVLDAVFLKFCIGK